MLSYRVQVVDVQSWRTQVEGTWQHLIFADTDQGHRYTFETVNDFKASLCQQAKEQRRWVDLEWKESSYGREIVMVHLREAVDAA